MDLTVPASRSATSRDLRVQTRSLRKSNELAFGRNGVARSAPQIRLNQLKIKKPQATPSRNIRPTMQRHRVAPGSQ